MCLECSGENELLISYCAQSWCARHWAVCRCNAQTACSKLYSPATSREWRLQASKIIVYGFATVEGRIMT